jgi:pimeloyl-ACP methyl ester carboxylesterase
MATFTAPDGVRLRYEVEGEGPALLLHLGAGCDAGLWRAAGYARRLCGSFRYILFDHRGMELATIRAVQRRITLTAMRTM